MRSQKSAESKRILGFLITKNLFIFSLRNSLTPNGCSDSPHFKNKKILCYFSGYSIYYSANAFYQSYNYSR